MSLRFRQLLGGWLMIGVLAVLAAGCGSGSSASGGSPGGSGTGVATSGGATRPPGAGKPPVTIGTKNFTESLILGQLYVQALRAKGYSVRLKSNIGATEVVDRKLAAGEIDGYPEYTGTILTVLAHDHGRPLSALAAYQHAARFERARGVTLLGMAPATDTDVVIAKPAYATRHRLRSLADLRRLGAAATLAAPPEFRTRFNGLVGLQQVYGVTALRFRPVPIGEQYRELEDGRAQLAAAFTTDGNLRRGDFRLLEDPKNIFGFQNVTFIVRSDVLAREGPAFAQTVNTVSAKLSTQALRVMNAAVELDQQSPEAVARQFLGANGLA